MRLALALAAVVAIAAAQTGPGRIFPHDTASGRNWGALFSPSDGSAGSPNHGIGDSVACDNQYCAVAVSGLGVEVYDSQWQLVDTITPENPAAEQFGTRLAFISQLYSPAGINTKLAIVYSEGSFMFRVAIYHKDDSTPHFSLAQTIVLPTGSYVERVHANDINILLTMGNGGFAFTAEMGGPEADPAGGHFSGCPDVQTMLPPGSAGYVRCVGALPQPPAPGDTSFSNDRCFFTSIFGITCIATRVSSSDPAQLVTLEYEIAFSSADSSFIVNLDEAVHPVQPSVTGEDPPQYMSGTVLMVDQCIVLGDELTVLCRPADGVQFSVNHHILPRSPSGPSDMVTVVGKLHSRVFVIRETYHMAGAMMNIVESYDVRNPSGSKIHFYLPENMYISSYSLGHKNVAFLSDAMMVIGLPHSTPAHTAYFGDSNNYSQGIVMFRPNPGMATQPPPGFCTAPRQTPVRYFHPSDTGMGCWADAGPFDATRHLDPPVTRMHNGMTFFCRQDMVNTGLIAKPEPCM